MFTVVPFFVVGIAQARTNVLFIDLNNADAEIRAVRSALPRDSALFEIGRAHV